MPLSLFLSFSLSFTQKKQAKHAAIADIVHELTALLEAGKDVNLNALKQEVREPFFVFSINHSTTASKQKENAQPQPKNHHLPYLRPRPATLFPRLPSS